MQSHPNKQLHTMVSAAHETKRPGNGASNSNGSHPLTKIFRKIAHRTGKIVGSPWSFVLACLFIILWLVTGPIFHFSDTWQLVVNTSTTIVTFLMVFLLQNTQNRDQKALHLKLDELIYVNKHARNRLMEAEELLDDDEMKRESDDFKYKREHFGSY